MIQTDRNITFGKRAQVVMSAMLIQGGLGFASSWGNIVVYVASYYRSFTHNEKLTLQFAQVIYPVTIICAASCMAIFKKQIDEMDPKPLLLIGGLIHFAALNLSSYLTNFTYFIVVYAMLGGFGFGLIYILPLKCAWSYFPQNRPFITVLIFGSFYFSAVFGSRLALFLINPRNIKPDVIETNGLLQEKFYSEKSLQVIDVPYMIYTMSFVSLFFYMVALPFLEYNDTSSTKREIALDRERFNRLQQNQQRNSLKVPLMTAGSGSSDQSLYPIQEFGQNELEQSDSDEVLNSLPASSDVSFQSIDLISLFIMLAMSMTFGFYSLVIFKSYGSLFHDDDMYLTQVGQIGLLFSAVFYIIWALIMQFMGFRKTYITILWIQTIIAITMTKVSVDKVLYQIWIAIAMVCYTGHWVIMRPFIHQIYGFNIGNRIVGLFLIGFGICFLFVVISANVCIPAFGWPAFFWAQAILSSLSLIKVLFCEVDLDNKIANNKVNYTKIYFTIKQPQRRTARRHSNQKNTSESTDNSGIWLKINRSQTKLLEEEDKDEDNSSESMNDCQTSKYTDNISQAHYNTKSRQ